MQNEPYFMKNHDWYVFDEEHMRYLLTASAPENAKKSYAQFYENEAWLLTDRPAGR